MNIINPVVKINRMGTINGAEEILVKILEEIHHSEEIIFKEEEEGDLNHLIMNQGNTRQMN